MAEHVVESFAVCGICWNAVSACTCPGKEVVAAEPVAEYMTLVDPATTPPLPTARSSCLRCLQCWDRTAQYCETCWYCTHYPDSNGWDTFYEHNARRHRNDPNPLREGETPLPPRERYECVCGETNSWGYTADVSGTEWGSFDPESGLYEVDESDTDSSDLSGFQCYDCDYEPTLRSDPELYGALLNAWDNRHW